MGRTLATAHQLILEEQRAFADFYRALRRSDQLVFSELFAQARKHSAAIAMAAHALPFEAMLLAMLLEESKKNAQLRLELESLKQALGELQRLVGQTDGADQ